MTTAQATYAEQGSGSPALLLLPGWCASRQVFAPIVPQLARRHRVISVDWPGHGTSPLPSGDFGFQELVDSAMNVVKTTGTDLVVPVALSHAGWVAIELRKRLGARIPALIFLDWLVLDPPAPFLGALAALQVEASWEQVREKLFSMWVGSTRDARVQQFLDQDMARFGFAMWARAGREIAGAYREHRSPLRALAALIEPPRACHIYAQPEDTAYLQAQKSFADEHPWFSVTKLHAHTHFPMFEVPGDLVAAVEQCLSRKGDA